MERKYLKGFLNRESGFQRATKWTDDTPLFFLI